MKSFLSIQSIIAKGINSRGGMSRSAIIISAVMEIKWEIKVFKFRTLLVQGNQNKT